jgi:2-polyprenyl-3-methyl-5-hydroxy-6-metoxy-1,4-benzoquinol methylase
MVGWNQRVLELGAASGHVTRALVAQHCRVTAIEYDADAATSLKEVAEDVVVGDLNDPGTLARYSAEFDVVLAGDVLEHLLDPQAVLNRATKLVVPGGRIVISLPNVAHADVRMALLQGRFDYTPWGLLDRTHVRFFTIKTIRDLVKEAGLQIIEMARVRMPAFETEQAIDRQSVPTAVVEQMLADPEAETYQFVFTTVVDDGNYRTAQLSVMYQELQVEHERLRVQLTKRLLDFERELKAEEARRKLVEEGREVAENDIARMQATRLFRYTRGLRQIYGSFRGNDR